MAGMPTGPRCCGLDDCLCPVCDPAFRAAVRADLGPAGGAAGGHPEWCCCPAAGCVAAWDLRRAAHAAEVAAMVADLERKLGETRGGVT